MSADITEITKAIKSLPNTYYYASDNDLVIAGLFYDALMTLDNVDFGERLTNMTSVTYSEAFIRYAYARDYYSRFFNHGTLVYNVPFYALPQRGVKGAWVHLCLDGLIFAKWPANNRVHLIAGHDIPETCLTFGGLLSFRLDRIMPVLRLCDLAGLGYITFSIPQYPVRGKVLRIEAQGDSGYMCLYTPYVI